MFATLLCAAALLPACGGGRNTPETTQLDDKASAKERTCDSIDPMSALAQPLDGAVSVTFLNVFPVRQDMEFTSPEGERETLKAGETVSLTTIVERDTKGRIRHQERVVPESFEVLHQEIVLTEDTAYVRFADGLLPGYDGVWVAAALEEKEYVESLLAKEPPTALELRDRLFGEGGGVLESVRGLAGVGRIKPNTLPDGGCRYEIEILPDWGEKEVTVETGSDGEVRLLTIKDKTEQLLDTVTISEGPSEIVVPSEIAPDAVGRAYVQR